MALLACPRYYWQDSGSAQESIREISKVQQVLERADELRKPRRAGGILKIRPVGGYPRLTAVRQNEHELQTALHAHLSKDLQRLSLKRVMWTRYGDAFGKLLMMGIVSRCPLTISREKP
jgi:hypothetical protein